MDRIDSYLADLHGLLRLSPQRRARLLAEVEEHLRDAASSERAAGDGEDAAAERALVRFGTAQEVAAAANAGTSVGSLALVAAQLVAAGCAAVLTGVLLSEALARLTSRAWVFGLPDAVTPAPSSIAHWRQVQPQAQGWRAAAAMENASDSLVLRGGATLLGLAVALLVVAVLRGRVDRPATGIVPVLGLSVFAAMAMILSVCGLVGAGQLDWGRGQSFSDAAVAAAAAAAHAAAYARRRPSTAVV